MDQKYFQTLARYNRWANKKLYDVVETLSIEKFEKDSQAYFGSIQGTLNHILFGDWAWCLRLQDKSSAHLEMGKIYHPEFSKLKAARLEADEEFVKILADAKTDRILGAHIIGPHGGDLIQEIVQAMEFGGSAEDVARTCHGHPGLPEAVKEAALAVAGRTINS